MAKGEIEVFEFLKAKSSIKGIDINDLQILLDNAARGKTYKNYTIKMINIGSILIFDSFTSNNIILRCVKEHLKTNNDCIKIKRDLEIQTEEINCSQCYLKYIEKIKNGTL